MQVWVVVIYFGVIAIYFKYKLVLSVSVISGKILDRFITSLKERERRWRRTMNAIGRELTSKMATKVKTEKFVFIANSKQTH